MKIGEAAKKTKLTTKAIRYYEELGLLKKAQRTGSGYRAFTNEDLHRLDFIRKAKNLGFSLEDIRETLTVYDAQGELCKHVLALLDRKIHRVEQWVEQLNHFVSELRKLRERSRETGEEECCGTICAIVDRGAGIGGQQSITWLESKVDS